MTFRKVAPELVFNRTQDVTLKSAFEDTFRPATERQELRSGTLLKTGEASFVEIQIEKNVVRLDRNTEVLLVENNFSVHGEPRFVFELRSGSIWVNAFDPIVIQTPQIQATFASTVGSYTYGAPLNRIMSIVGHVDLDLYHENGDLLQEFVIPINNQVTVVDAQLIPEYSKLQYSKLKKELKMSPLSSRVFQDDWVIRNSSTDASLHLAETEGEYIANSSEYTIKSRYLDWGRRFIFLPPQKRMNLTQSAQLKLYYLLGALHENGQRSFAKDVLAEFDDVASELEGDPTFRDMIERQFFVIRNVKKDSPGYLTKDNLRLKLFGGDRPEILRSYLDDLDFTLRIRNNDQALLVAEEWLSSWNSGLRDRFLDEFRNQSRIFQSIILTHSDTIESDILHILDRAGDYRLEESETGEDELFEIALERLEVGKYLVSKYRYGIAKDYLKTSYDDLNLANAKAAARDVFLQDATILGERIAYAERNLKGAAEPIDETKFREYLKTIERDRGLEIRFQEFLEERESPALVVDAPSISDVVSRFTLSRIIILNEDVEVDPQYPFEFMITGARLLDRSKDGMSITFSATYDYLTNGIYEIEMNEKPIRGSYSLQDFVKAAKAGDALATVGPSTNTPSVKDIFDVSDDAESNQIVAQDLATRLAIGELEKENIGVPSISQVTVLNPATLNEFHFKDIFILDPDTGKEIQLEFDYNTLTKKVSNVTFAQIEPNLPAQIDLSNFVELVLKAFREREAEIAAISELQSLFQRAGIEVDSKDLTFLDSELNSVNVKEGDIEGMPIPFSGVLDRNTRQFNSVQSAVFSSQGIALSDFSRRASEQWLIGHFNSNGVVISVSNIGSQLPSTQVRMRNVAKNNKVFDFTFNTATNQLLNVRLQGTDTVVDALTFEEFALIQ